MKRLWRPYWEWECYKHGMWDKAPRDREHDLLLEAIKFTGNAELYGYWMLEAVKAFRRSCEHHLTDTSLNRQAYVGHAACALYGRLPEYIVRKAWGCLSKEQRDRANAVADIALLFWTSIIAGNGEQLAFEF